MVNPRTEAVTLRPQELEAVYAISQAVAIAKDTESVLDQVIHLARPVFIFDNIVLYEKQDDSVLEPTYAKAIGRGRAREAELSWGEIIANDVYKHEKKITRVEDLGGSTKDRTNIRHFLGMPLKLGGEIVGSLVFIRFGGPVYTSDQVHLAEFIAVHIAQLLGHQHLVDQIATLEAKRRLDSLQEDFIAMVSHELLTPLGFIKGYATTLLRDDTKWDKQTEREFLTIIDEEADRLRELIDNLMDSSRLQAGTLYMSFQTTRLDTLLRDISLRAKSLHENLTIHLDIKQPGLAIPSDPTRLAQVFDNIISNAVKYAPGSAVRISLDKVDNVAKISIRDYGPGISPDHISKIFQRFYRVPDHASLRGSGLGLYICQKIIQAHDGDIKAKSNVGEGTTFIISLPCERNM